MRYKNFFKIKNIKRIFLSHPEYVVLFITTLVSLIYFSWGINSWKFAMVGDEWAYYSLAKQIAVNNNFLINPFDFHGVYNIHSLLPGLYQAIFLKLLGPTNFAWRLSNIILLFPLTFFFYLWIKNTLGSKRAFYATLLLQASFYLANFFKIGYYQPQALTLFTVCLYLSTLCIKHHLSKIYLILLGISLGISFYIYNGLLFPFLIWPYLLPIFFKENKKEIIMSFMFLALPYFIFTIPALLNLQSLSSPGNKIIAREYSNNMQMLVNTMHNFLLFYKNYDYLYNHFVAGPYLDIVTRIFAFIGTGVSLRYFRKLPYLQLLLSYVSTCIILGVTNPYAYTPTTRGLVFLPFGFAFAAVGLYWFIQNIMYKKIAFIIVFLFIFTSNLYKSQIGVFKEAGYTGTSLIIKSLQDTKENSPERKIVLLLSNYNGYNYPQIYAIQQAYDLQSIKFEVIRSGQLQCSIVKNTDMLFFDNDLEAKYAASRLKCPLRYNLSIKTLTPNIYL